jgi:predicted nucleic acid-binding protein
MILDTSFVVDLLDGKPAAVDLQNDLAGEQAYLSPATMMELWRGTRRNGSEEQEAAVLQFIDDFAAFPFDRQAALTAGEISADLAGRGAMIEMADIITAAIALEHNAPVVTDDDTHFDRVTGLDVITY